jgi:hypothetical protein
MYWAWLPFNVQYQPSHPSVSSSTVESYQTNKLFSNGTSFTEGMIKALLCYIVNIYPEGVKLCKLLDQLSQHIMKGLAYNDHWPDSTTLEKLGSYTQTEEKEGSGFNENWVLVETSASAINKYFV